MEFERLDFDQIREEYPDRWARGDPLGAAIAAIDSGWYVVRRADSEHGHECTLGRAYGETWGACSCDGFKHHTPPCSHLIALTRAAGLGQLDVPRIDVHSVVGDVRTAEEEQADADLGEVVA